MKRTSILVLFALLLTLVCAVGLTACGQISDIIGGIVDNVGGETPGGETPGGDNTECTEHAFGDWIMVTPAACETEGKEERICSTCNEREERAVIALGHDEQTHAAQAPTCIEKGWDAYVTCSRCDYTTYAEKTVLGHDFAEDWDYTTKDHYHACTRTGCTEKNSVAEHVYDTELDEACNVCGAIRAVSCSHVNSKTIPGYPATCTKPGLTDGSECTACGETLIEQESIDALGHDEVAHKALPPTCTRDGWDAFVTCSRCDYITYERREALGHAYATAWSYNATEHYHSCTRTDCTAKADTAAHVYDGELDGNCNVCGATRVVSCSHPSSVTVPGYPATCTAPGLTNGSKCGACDTTLVLQREIAAHGHNYVWIVDMPATVTTSGIKHEECTRCQDKQNENTVIPAETSNVTIIYTAEQLLNLSMDGNYILGDNIDLGGIEWTPIGTNNRVAGGIYSSSDDIKPFVGTFDGNGYTISNFKITAGYGSIGFFGYNKGIIQNLALKDFAVSAAGYVGGLVGYNDGGNISNCYVIGSVKASAMNTWGSPPHYYSCAGGLIGYNDKGTVAGCYAACSVQADSPHLALGVMTGAGSQSYAGGLVGYNNEGNITNCYATGNIIDAHCSGALVGLNHSGAIQNCYATGNANSSNSGYPYAGGLVGYNEGTINNCYAVGNVAATALQDGWTGTSCGGGLVGYNNATVANCYRYIGQSITANSVNTTGGSKSMPILQSVSFQTNTLGWSTNVWIFVEGRHPVLKKAGGQVHVHTYANTYSYDEAYHWYAATCGCEVVKEKAEHVFVESVCVCGKSNEQGTAGLVYTLNSDGKTYAVTDYTGTAKSVVIPATYMNKPVVGIGSFAFADWTSLVSITIPDSVTSVGSWAFSGCASLSGIEIPNSVTDIGYRAFFGCTSLASMTVETGNTVYHSAGNCIINTATKTLIAGCKTSVIPSDDSVTSIDSYAFWGCTSLTSIEIPSSVTSICWGAFGDCTSLTSIEIPGSVTSIDDLAFSGCTSLASITVEAGNTIYHSDGNCIIETATNTLIAGCKTSVIPSDGSVTSIGDYAFWKCANLTSITIPDRVISIGNEAFSYCTSLASMTVETGNIVYHSVENCIIETSTKTLIAGCKTSVIPSDGSVTSISDYAFRGCTSLTSIEIPDNVTSIGSGAFAYCTNLVSITVEAGNTIYHSDGNCIIKTATKTLIAGCKTSVIPSDDSVTSISFRAFWGCTSLTSIEIPDNVTSIDNLAFYGCTSLLSITIPNRVTRIGWYAFYGCTSLTSIKIPDSVTSIGEHAFDSCTSLKRIDYTGTKAQWNAISKGPSWNYGVIGCIVYCSDGNIAI